MNKSATALRIPDSMGRADIGPYLRELRQYFTLTTQEVSDRLHIRVRYVAALEEGQFDQLPGKAYARGYLHSYAEFLGLDADQVVAQCFAIDPSTATQPSSPTHFVPTTKRTRTSSSLGGQYARASGIVIVLALLAMVAFTQLRETASHSEESTPAVAPVPEALLASMRTVIMPTAHNKDCLTDNALLSCFFAQEAVQEIEALQSDMPFIFSAQPLLYDDTQHPPEKFARPISFDNTVDEESNSHE